jgi:hypothetical protein
VVLDTETEVIRDESETHPADCAGTLAEATVAVEPTTATVTAATAVLRMILDRATAERYVSRPVQRQISRL